MDVEFIVIYTVHIYFVFYLLVPTMNVVQIFFSPIYLSTS
jgi:hypothetical protein